MSEATDRLLSRRASWDGAVVQCLNVPQSDPSYGKYYRVRYSHRDPDTGAWEIRWDPQADLVERMAARWETIYRFDGTTWDLPTKAAHAVPWATIAVCAMIGTVCWPLGYAAFGNYEFAAYVFMACLAVPLWNWFYNVEPVRGTKVAAAMTVAHVAAQAHYKAEAERMHAERAAQYYQSVAEAQVRFGHYIPVPNQTPMPEQILASGLILPAEHVKDGWKR